MFVFLGVTNFLRKASLELTFLAWAVCFPITDHVIFSREVFFYPYKIYSFIYTRLFENLKARILKSIIIWYVMGQQNAQAKKVYSLCHGGFVLEHEFAF